MSCCLNPPFAIEVNRCLVCLFVNLVSNVEVPIPCLRVPPPRCPSTYAAAVPLADSYEEVPIPHFLPQSALVSCDSGDEDVILCLILLRLSSTSTPVFSLCQVVAIANVLWGMVKIDFSSSSCVEKKKT
jgi:hypothetical protein